MCYMCDQGMTPEQLIRDLRNKIIDTGMHQVMVVEGSGENWPDPEHPDLPYSNWAYSIGRTFFDAPEIVLAGGMSPTALHGMVNDVIKYAEDNDIELTEGTEFPANTIITNFPMRLRAIKTGTEITNLVEQVCGSDYVALQLMFPDPNGRFWDEEGYDMPPQMAPIFEAAE